jgi:hypothetical protein
VIGRNWERNHNSNWKKQMTLFITQYGTVMDGGRTICSEVKLTDEKSCDICNEHGKGASGFGFKGWILLAPDVVPVWKGEIREFLSHEIKGRFEGLLV